VLAAGTMFVVLIMDRKARAAPRSRMLITLAFTDFLFAVSDTGYFANMLAHSQIQLADIGYEGPLSQQVLLFWWFLTTCASWLWTAFIAEHIVFVSINEGHVSMETEHEREGMYYKLWIGIMILGGVPALAFFSWGPGQFYERTVAPDGQFRNGDTIGYWAIPFVFLCASMFWVGICLCRLVVASARRNRLQTSSRSGRYARQMIWFLAAFMALTISQLIQYRVLLQRQTPSDTLAYAAYTASFLPVANAFIWGFSPSCAIRCILISCYGVQSKGDYQRRGEPGLRSKLANAMRPQPTRENELGMGLLVNDSLGSNPSLVPRSSNWGKRLHSTSTTPKEGTASHQSPVLDAIPRHKICLQVSKNVRGLVLAADAHIHTTPLSPFLCLLISFSPCVSPKPFCLSVSLYFSLDLYLVAAGVNRQRCFWHCLQGNLRQQQRGCERDW
jgi:hypothetical protein